MSRYPVTYYSTSKKKEEVIEEMSAFHLLNAYRKLRGDEKSNPLVVQCMEAEIDRRGLDPSKPNSEQAFPAEGAPND